MKKNLFVIKERSFSRAFFYGVTNKCYQTGKYDIVIKHIIIKFTFLKHHNKLITNNFK